MANTYPNAEAARAELTAVGMQIVPERLVPFRRREMASEYWWHPANTQVAMVSVSRVDGHAFVQYAYSGDPIAADFAAVMAPRRKVRSRAKVRKPA